jgi:hypothetical protein
VAGQSGGAPGCVAEVDGVDGDDASETLAEAQERAGVVPQRAQLVGRQLEGGSPGVQPGAGQQLGAGDVADPGHDPVIHEHRPDGTAAARGALDEPTLG